MSVRTDVINLSVNVNGNVAQNQLNDLRKRAADLTFEIKDLKKAQKDYSSQATELSKVTGQMDDLKKHIGLTGLSTKELGQELRRLYAIQGTKGALSEEWVKWQGEINKVKARLDEVKEKAGAFKQVAGESGGTFGKIFEHVAEAFTAYRIIESVTASVKEFFTGSIEKASELDKAQIRLQNTLSNLGKSEDFEKINTDTEQLLQQFKYLEKADVFEVFNKLNTYGKLSESQMQDLTKVIIDFAAKSGQKVPEATSVILKALEGNARALKEYGINMREGSNVTERFGIIMEQLKPRVEGAGKAFQQSFEGKAEVAEEQVNRLKETIGARLLPVIERYHESVAGMAESLLPLFQTAEEKTKALTESFHQQQDEVQHLEKDILPLANRYDELKSKTNLSKTEQQEMKGIIDQIVAVMPGAVTQFDAYGNAIAVSTSRVREFVETEKARLQVVNKTVIEENQKLLEETAKQLEDQARVKDQIEKGTFTVTESSSGGTGGASLLTRKATQTEIAAEEEKYRTLYQNYIGYVAQINKLRGVDLDNIKKHDDDEKKSSEETLATLKKQLEDLQKAREDINVKDKKALQDNANQQIALQKKIQELEINPGKKNNQFDEEKKQAQELVKSISDLFKHLSEDPYLYSIGKILQERKEQIEKLDVALLHHAISQEDHDKATTQLVAIAQEKIQNLFNDSIGEIQKQAKDIKLEKPKPIDIEFKPHIDFLSEEEVQNVGKDAMMHLEMEQREKVAAASLRVLQANFPQRLNAIKNQLDLEKQTELDSKEHTESEKKLIEDKYQQMYVQAVKDHAQEEIEAISEVLNFASQAIDVWSKFNAARSAKENAALNKELKANDLKKAAYKKELDGKLLSQAQYDKKVEELDSQANKKKDEVAKKQFERDKKNQIAQAIASGAMGIVSTLAAKPGATDIISLGLFRAIEIGLVVATTAAQVAAISKTQYESSSSSYEKGGKLEGPSHANGGIQLGNDKTGSYYGEAEGEEAVINKGVLKDKNTYSFRGTPSQIASAINGLNGGNTWEQGATVVQMPAWRTQKPAQINPNMPRIMEQGGIVRPINGSTQQSNSHTESNAVLVEMKQELSGMREDMQNWKTQLHAVVSIKEYRDQERKYDAAKKASGIAQ